MDEKLCSIEGCINKHIIAFGMCNKHYKRFKRYGDANYRTRLRGETLLERLMARVKKNEKTGCWEYTGSLNGKGYGVLSINKTSVKAHRVSYEEFVGRIPGDLFVLHKCDNRKCVNPKHLFLGTHIENMQDMVRKGRSLRKPGSKQPNSKLKESDISTIRSRLSSGESSKDISVSYSVTRTTISRIKNNKAWTHVKENCHGI